MFLPRLRACRNLGVCHGVALSTPIQHVCVFFGSAFCRAGDVGAEKA
jgi:hypothetical protein